MKARRPPFATARPEAPSDPIVAFFDRQARGYDLQLILERRALRAAAALAEPLAGTTVIDLAAGTRAFSAAILDRGHALRALTLVDGAARMLERAPARLRAAGITPMLIVADARATPLADGSADVVAIGYLLHLLEPDARREVLDEAFRLLRPHGRLVVVVHGSPRGRRGSVYRRGWRLLHRLLPWGGDRRRPDRRSGPSGGGGRLRRRRFASSARRVLEPGRERAAPGHAGKASAPVALARGPASDRDRSGVNPAVAC